LSGAPVDPTKRSAQRYAQGVSRVRHRCFADVNSPAAVEPDALFTHAWRGVRRFVTATGNSGLKRANSAHRRRQLAAAAASLGWHLGGPIMKVAIFTDNDFSKVNG